MYAIFLEENKMQLTKKEKVETNKYELHISVEKATFDAAIEKAYRKQVKKINVPGFRKGKAPRNIIEKMYGKGVFYEDAINDIIPSAYADAVKEADINPISQPDFDVVSVDENGLVLSAKVYVKPDVEIKDYVGINVTKTVSPVTDEEIDREIDMVRNRNSREIDVTDRAAELGDTTVIDFDGSVDGVPFDGGKGTDYALKLGSGQFIPGFEDQIVGKNIDDEFDVNVKFPEDYHAKELAGKDAVFKVKIHAITKVELPELDDEFAKDISEFNTFDEYKNDLKAKIEKRHENEASANVDEQLLSALIDKLVAEIPEPMFVNETENFVRDYDNRLRMQGLDLNTYFKYTGLDLDKLREQFRPQAERQVKARLALEKIAEIEAIVPTDAEIEEEFASIASQYNIEVEQVKSSIDYSAIAEDMKVKKAMDFVKEKALITEKAPESEKKEKAAKSTKTSKKAKEAAPKTEENN